MAQPLEKVDRRDAKLALAHLFVAFAASRSGGSPAYCKH
ncbi:SubunitIof c(o/b)3-type cytochrome c oxidase [Geobacillus sp. WSUCF1]|nr:SubunitIof c(o/b)3-type cytochrome c oxidase [Geobacillus sp. WSUCF1]